MEFDWDPVKAVANERKHGIAFVRAATVFNDPLHLEEDAARPEHGEPRGKAIGLAGAVVVAVIYTDRGGKRRIISARRACRDERRRYGQGTAAS